MRYFQKIVFFLWILGSFQGKAQEFPYHYFSHTHPVVSNPSLAAADVPLKLSFGAYNLWAGGFKPVNDYLVGFSFSPDRSRYGNLSWRQTRVGLGAILFQEEIGPFRQNRLHVMYAYHIPLSREVRLSLGVAGIVEYMNIDVNALTPADSDDPRLQTGANQSFLFDGGVGASVWSENFRVGLSVLNLAPGEFRFSEEAASGIPLYRKFFLDGQYGFELYRNMKVEPRVTIRNSFPQELNFDGLVQLDFQLLQVGAGYRSEQTLFFFARVPVKGFIFSYTSENPLGSNHMMGNGHSVGLSWVPGNFL